MTGKIVDRMVYVKSACSIPRQSAARACFLNERRTMRSIRLLVLSALLVPAVGYAADKEGRNEEQQTKKSKADEKAKEGALKEKADPAKDLKLQEQNVKKLR